MSVWIFLSFLLIEQCTAQLGFPFLNNQQIQNRQFGFPGNFFFPGQFQQPNFQQQPFNQQPNYNQQPYNQNPNNNYNFYLQQFPQYNPNSPNFNNQNRPPQNPPQQNQQRPPQNPPLQQQMQRPPQNPPQQNTQRPPQNPPRPSQPQRPQQSTGRPINQVIDPNERISEKKCREYSWVAKKPGISVSSLSLDADVQSISVDNCEASIGLVVGGEDAKKGEFPHMAALGYPAGLGDGGIQFKCGGSLISERFVLTAAHCKKADRVEPTRVRLGDLNLKLREPELPETDVPIVRFIAHENYNRKTMFNDIAVVEMDRNVPFSQYLRPACLATPKTPSRPKAIASGWGFLEVGGRIADHLQKVELSIIDIPKCKELYKDEASYKLNNKQLCAGELAGGKDTCQGDSGGPLQIAKEGNKCMFVILGITSYGPTFCGQADQPGIYTRVAGHLDWIEQKVWGQN